MNTASKNAQKSAMISDEFKKLETPFTEFLNQFIFDEFKVKNVEAKMDRIIHLESTHQVIMTFTAVLGNLAAPAKSFGADDEVTHKLEYCAIFRHSQINTVVENFGKLTSGTTLNVSTFFKVITMNKNTSEVIYAPNSTHTDVIKLWYGYTMCYLESTVNKSTVRTPIDGEWLV